MNRREFLVTSGGLAVAFSLRADASLDAWIRVGPDGALTVFTGKVELGQGLKTALLQVAAEGLGVPLERLTLVTADTARTPNEGYTAGSLSMQDSGTAIFEAARALRARLEDGKAGAPTQPAARTAMGRSHPRIDIPPKLAGQAIYVQDLRLPGMVHARVVRPPAYGARLVALDSSTVEKLPGVLRLVRDGSFVAVLAEREWQAVRAMRALAAAARWSEAKLPDPARVYDDLQRLPSEEFVLLDSKQSTREWTHEATYRRPYQMHGAIGPSCAVALYRDDALTVWTHSQGVYPLRGAIAQMLGLAAERVRCIHMEGAGCYGHNGADDAAADAALIARAFPGRPVRVQWMREDEHAWEPYGSAMVTRARARLEGERIADWAYDVWSDAHATRPGPAGNLSTAWLLAKPFAPPRPRPIPQPAGGGDRNAIPLYRFGATRVVNHFVTAMPLRVSALRALGGYMNVFSIESFMDELATAARADPVAFRLAHLDDPRAREVVRAAAERFGWSAWRKQPGRGRGIAFARYKNTAAYCAVACEVEAERASGRIRFLRAAAAIDSGEAVNPDGIINQVEGGILQSVSWTLYEAVRHDQSRITSLDWAAYPILRFPDVPDALDVIVITRPGAPFLGTGEAAQGPAAGALANAIADATGMRLREIPLIRGQSPNRSRTAQG
jgi:nicotinate dehydrogenase subunit B